jgi:hypothetical protein
MAQTFIRPSSSIALLCRFIIWENWITLSMLGIV